MKHKFSLLFVSLLILLSIMITSAYSMQVQPNAIVVTTTIQAAVDAAQPGDIVRVPPGIYRENVLVSKNNITIKGQSGAVLDGTNLLGNSGITVRSSSPSARINGFRLSGLQIQNYSRNGIFLVRVDNYQIEDGKYLNNEEYGIFPIRSSHGLIRGNQVSGSNDTGIYIGQSQDALIKGNYVSDCTVGIEVEVSSTITVKDNTTTQNTIGMTAVILPGLSLTVTNDIQIIDNTFDNNNRANPATDPEDILSQLPSGSGLLIFGADHVSVRDNHVIGNNSVGIAVAQLPPALASLDPRIDPFPDYNEIVDNVVADNGSNPDPKLSPFPPSDLLWDFSGTSNCWSDNTFNTAFPSPLPDCQPSE
jgi:parallel beta-helix repeat protein